MAMRVGKGLGAGSLLVVAGLVTAVGAYRSHASSTKILLEASFEAVSSTRELDAVAAQLAASKRIPAAKSLEKWHKETTDQEVKETLKPLFECFKDYQCDQKQVGVLMDAARTLFRTRLARSWEDKKRSEQKSDLLVGIGAFLTILGAALALFFGAQRTPGRSPKLADLSREEVEDLLKKRSADLYSAHLKGWETDRFAAFGEVAAGLSHGLKTPLASIRAAAQVAGRKLGDDHPALAQVQDIIAQTDELTEQVRRFLQVTGSGTLLPVSIPASKIVDALREKYGHSAKEKGLELEATVDGDLGNLSVDLGLLTLALSNLVENALAASPRGSKVSILARSAAPPSRVGTEGDAPDRKHWVEVAVEDEGPGISESVASGGDVKSTKPTGTGLGLAIARRIVSRHGGALICGESAKGGASVRAVLPVDEETD